MKRFKAAVFDWAGTTVDYGCFAPVEAFLRAFAAFGIKASIAEARAPMGKPKWDHVHTMLTTPRIAAQWQTNYCQWPTSADVDAVYKVFVPMNEAIAADCATLVPGTKAAIDELRALGLKIGSTTGYTRSIMERVLPVAAAQGYAPDNLVCADDLAEGRPGPLGMYKCMVDLVVYPPETIVKVDDTAPGIAEGVAAGCLTVGVALSGNTVGLAPEEVAALSENERSARSAAAAKVLFDAGADHVIATVADLPALLRRLDLDSVRA